MDIIHHLFVLQFITSLSVVFGEERGTNCTSPQYIEYGKTGFINCEFATEFYAVYWYNSTNVVTDLPILRFENSIKSGPGFDTGEFDVHQNGSLVINGVTLEHDHAFAVTYAETKDSSSPIIINVLVVVTITPAIPYPHIDKCEQDTRICFAEIDNTSKVICSVEGARPNIDLYWVTRTANGDRNISSDTFVSAMTGAFTSQATVSRPFNQSQLLELLICKAEDLSDLLKHDESIILVQNRNISIPAVEPTAVQAMYSTKFELSCGERRVSNIVWKREVSDGKFDTIGVSFANEKVIAEGYEERFTIGREHSLNILDVRVEDEGAYACIYTGEGIEGINTFEISVAVLPKTRYPQVDGCYSQYCTKNAKVVGWLTCEVKRIRPKISLKWRTRHSDSASKINFRKQEVTTTVSSDGDTYDVSLTSEYTLTDTSQRRLIVECAVIAKEFDLYEMSTIVDLVFQNGSSINPTADTTGHKRTRGSLAWMLIFVIIFILVMCVAAYFVFRKRKPRKKYSSSMRQSELEKEKPDEDEQENEPMYHVIEEDPYTETDGSRPKYEIQKLKELRKRLQESPNLNDLCKVPVHFIEFLTITGEIDTLPKFNNVTNMFRNLISRFFDLKRSELNDQEDQSDLLIERDHHKLDKFAFNGLLLAHKGNEIVWSKQNAFQEIGEDLYQECIKLGILVENEGLYDDQLEVRFFDKLICHWYAAHYFSYRFSTYGREDARKYLRMDPCEHHYFYRFSCGLHLTTFEEVKKYFTQLPDGSGDRLTILWDLEQTGNMDNTKQDLKELFKDLKFVEIRQEDKKLFQMSTIQLCEIAHSLEIILPPLWLMGCFGDVDIGNVKLKNGLLVSLGIFKEVRIEEEKKELTQEKICQILELATKSGSLKTIVFWRCLVPESLQENKDLLASLQKTNVTVRWLSKPGEFYHLNYQTGHWEEIGGQELTNEKYAEEVKGFLETAQYSQ